MTKTMTLKVPTESGMDRIKITARSLTSMGNLRGWNVTINGAKRFVGLLTPEEAIDHAYVRWVKENR